MKDYVYIASTLTNADRVRKVRDRLAAHGIGLTYDWTAHQDGIPYIPDEKLEDKRRAAINEYDAVCRAKVVLVIQPGGRGTYFEYGVARANKKPIVWLDDREAFGDRPCFDFLPGLYKCRDETEAVVTVLHLIRETTDAERDHDQA